MMETKRFYDTHMHVFDLSHPNLSAFILKKDLIDSVIKSIKWWWRLLLVPVGALVGVLVGALGAVCPNKLRDMIWWFLTKKDNNGKSSMDKISDTLSFFEIPHEYQFLVMDELLARNNPLNGLYDKIVLCPLIIDFGYKNLDRDGGNFNFSPKHPIAKQTGDLLYAIRTYYRFNLKIENGKLNLDREIPDWQTKKSEKQFEIYPFMGLDTRNYDEPKDIQKLLDKYFSKFSNEPAEERRKRLFEKAGTLSGNMYGDSEDYKAKNNGDVIDYSDAFAGIKVYPQLGFDPYPNDQEELKKVKCLYKTCIEKRIPIITHCSDGGYKTGDNDGLTSPDKWEKVLTNGFHNLTLNFAHFGSQKDKKTKWRNKIIDLTRTYPNVYTDISCNDMKPEYYSSLEKDIRNSAHLREKVLFGSDFSINLLVTDTKQYSDNLRNFIESKNLSSSYKTDLCEVNPEVFLFGNTIKKIE
ncbi:hypothetical protein FACS189426_14350 [Bacteroidia bacterium]|nr:hypothetical protein FACS189426_14350 [Bacteroidia bacterium]GHV70496.1 hypothetical protein FACS189420_1820 [Bacteroidia bacterium]